MNMMMNNLPCFSDLRLLFKASHPKTKNIDVQLLRYERFFFLIKKFPNLKAVPTKAIDRIWHFHLDHKTLYEIDCMSYAGRLISHKETSTAIHRLKENYVLTNKLWLLTFNEHMGDFSAMAFCGTEGDGSETGTEN